MEVDSFAPSNDISRKEILSRLESPRIRDSIGHSYFEIQISKRPQLRMYFAEVLTDFIKYDRPMRLFSRKGALNLATVLSVLPPFHNFKSGYTYKTFWR